MKKLILAGLALSAVFATRGEVQAYVNYPWCVNGETRGFECYFSTKEQCAQDGRGRGFGTQCIRNPDYNPALPSFGGGGQAQPAGLVLRKSRKHRHDR